MSPIDELDAKPLLEPRDGIPAISNGDVESLAQIINSHTGPIAVDTERAMGIRYSNRAYLIQLKRADSEIILLDPIGIEDQLSPLVSAMNAEWILHAADQDLPCLRELGFEPASIFDTELAGLILGFDRVSLQSMVAEVLGWALAKEHSSADWSVRPLGPELRAYAALDVDLLAELREELIAMLTTAGRLEWHRQECEDVRLRPAPTPSAQPWRKATRQAGIRDRRALAMFRELWNARDGIAKSRDLAPGKVFPTRVLAELAMRKPRSRADVVHSTLMRSKERQAFVDPWWRAINTAWHLDDAALPDRRYKEKDQPFPPQTRWSSLNPEAEVRWGIVRPTVIHHADELGIRQDVLLKPAYQKQLAWEGWKDESELRTKLAEYGARPWQIDQVTTPILTAQRANR